MKLPNMNSWSCGVPLCTNDTNPAADIALPVMPNPVPQQMLSVAKPAKRPGISCPEWIGGLNIRKPKEKDVSKFGLLGPRQLGKCELDKPLTVSTSTTSTVFISILRRKHILETIRLDLKNDIEKVLAVYTDDESNTQKTGAVNKEFFRLYALLLKKTSYASFENQAFRNLMRNVAKEISKRTCQDICVRGRVS